MVLQSTVNIKKVAKIFTINSGKLCIEYSLAARHIGAPDSACEKYLFILGIRAKVPNSYIYREKFEINKLKGWKKRAFGVSLATAVDLADCEKRRPAP